MPVIEMRIEDFNAINRETPASGSLSCPRCGKTTDDAEAAKRLHCPHCNTRIRSTATFLVSVMSSSEVKRARAGRMYVRELRNDPERRYLAVERFQASAQVQFCERSGAVLSAFPYASTALAIVAAATWDPLAQPEPFGFTTEPTGPVM